MILNDKQIIKLAEEHEMISPFVNKSVANGISHGVNPFGYDLRCGSEFKIFTNIKGATADPKNFSEDNFITVKDEESILIPPNSFALAASLEYFKNAKKCYWSCHSKINLCKVWFRCSTNGTRGRLGRCFSFRIFKSYFK